MNTIKTYFSLFMLVAVTSIFLSAQKDNNHSITKNFDLDDFHSIGLGISADVYVTQGNEQSVRVEGSAKDIETLNTKVNNGSWRIKSNKKNYRYDKMTIYITMKTLEAISIGGSGSIEGTNKFSNLDDLELSIGGSGNIELDFVADHVECSIGGSGTMKLDGTCNGLEISIGGSGDVKAFGLQTKTCEVSAAGSGDVQVSVSDDLQVSTVGSGDVEYKGNPRIESSTIGSGSVRKKGSM